MSREAPRAAALKIRKVLIIHEARKEMEPNHKGIQLEWEWTAMLMTAQVSKKSPQMESTSVAQQ